ncbi:hypothetical protein COEREDRAFT_96315 [Coemansia reversa NRRL 1564]|uniref:Structure-specific endonuclease subunit SLX4 n=1 Tax=Coemansia reversa (strain ATCC 12441 / NRRL 1564) TaxID=763665 RepID=A0A2G5BGP6_COERN|nr:hypothetical protein COEREDRAFT_96315 [Coemansia reversa NRRL 1564]|eukprot:PIA18173.1 hypothetical protein COEREDRAFT_96315 [Coemansia reversa NRRL 1564]
MLMGLSERAAPGYAQQSYAISFLRTDSAPSSFKIFTPMRRAINDKHNSLNASVFCALCSIDITALGSLERNAHVEECLDTGRVASPRKELMSEAELTTATLDRLNDCPVCGAVWPLTDSSRIKHVKGCAAEHGLSAKELVTLIELFRESLDSSSRASAADAETSCGRPSALAESQSSDSSCSCSSSRKALDLRPQRAKDSSTTNITIDNGQTKPIDSWFGHRRSKTSVQSKGNDEKLLINNNAHNGPSVHSKKSRSSISFDIAEDNDFQTTKIRIPLRQTVLSTRRVGKKRQEALDEMDDDLNEAKALSLSLRHGSELELSKQRRVNSKRKDARSKATELLSRSDILASKEAQSYIRQRAVAFRYMDEKRETATRCVEKFDSDASIGPASVLPTDSELWRMASQDKMPERRYCSIFEGYHMCHQRHVNEDACVEDLVEHVIKSLALGCHDNGSETHTLEPVTEESLRNGYACVLQAAHRGLSRQLAALKCEKWVGAQNTANQEKANVNISGCVVLSSSVSSSSSFSRKSNQPDISCSVVANQSENPVPYVAPRTDSRSDSSPDPNLLPAQYRDYRLHTDIMKPDYEKMSIDTLKQAAADYGLRVNTPKRLLIHQLKVIWERLHQVSENAGPVNSNSYAQGRQELPTKEIDEIEVLFAQLRKYIRGERDLYEQILCYQVLEFELVYQRVSGAVPCHKKMLRKFFDSEGIVYSSYAE